MAQVLYGASTVQTLGNADNFRYDFLGKDSEVFASGDIVQVTSGVLNVGTVTAVGYVVKAQTMGSTNDTVYPAFHPFSPDEVYLMGTNSDLTDNETDGGKYFQVTGATGAQQVNVSIGTVAGAVRSVEIVKVDPFGIGGSGSGSGLRQVLVHWVKTPNYNVNITA